MTTPTQHGCSRLGDPRARVAALREEVDGFVEAIVSLTPAARLRLLTQLQQQLAQAVDAAQAKAITDAAAQGWGLRRIADQCGISHEQVRRLLARAPGPPRTPNGQAKRGKEQAICRACAGVARRFCARCGTEDGLLPGGRCQRCTLADQLTELLDDGTGRIHPPLQPLVEALHAAPEPRASLEWLADARVRELLAGLATGRIALSHEALHPLEPVGTVDHLRDLLVCHGVLPPLDKQLALFERWLPRFLAAITNPVHARLLGHFATWHVLHRLRGRAARHPLTPSAHRQAKQQLSQAAALLAWLDARGRPLGEFRQADLDAWFAEHTATRRPSRAFLRWCVARGHIPTLAIPTSKAVNPAPITQHRRLELIRALLTSERAPLRFRVAGLLVALYAQPVTRIIRLTVDDVIRDGNEVLLRLGDPPITVPEPFASLLEDYLRQRPDHNTAANPASTWLFPGRRAGQPLDATTVRDALRHAGVPALRARSAALRQLVLQAPAPVVAGMLGYHDTTTTRTAAEAGSPWSRYAPGDHTR